MSPTRRLASAMSAAWILVMGAAFVALEPSGTVAAAPALRALAGLTAAAVACLACTGAGGALLARLAPRSLEGPEAWLFALAAGLVLWGSLSWPAALLMGVHSWGGVVLLTLLAAGWLLRPAVPLPRLGLGPLALGLIFLIPALLCLSTPITDTDELYYHLALPARMLDEGQLLGGPWMPNGSRPLALHLPYAWLMGLGGPAAARAFHLLLGAALLLGVYRGAQRRWGGIAAIAAPLLLLGSTSFLRELGLAYADIPTALLVLVAAEAALAGWLPLLAIAAGGALAIKYTAAAALVPLFAILLLRPLLRGRAGWSELRGFLLAGLAGLALTSPWWLRNLLQGLHPLFPFSGWQEAGPFVFQFPDKYGMGHGWLDTLLLPWNLSVHAEHDSMVFLGRISPAFLALAPAALWAAWRDRRVRLLLGTGALGLLLWSFGTQWLRYLLPLLPLLALACAAGLARLPRWVQAAALLCWLAGLPANLRPVLADAAERAPVALGLEEPEAYLARRLDAWPAVHWINEHSPPEARVALLFGWYGAALERPWILGSVEDHVPTRHLLAVHGDGVIDALREAGATHVLTSRVRFLRKSYPFLGEEAFEAQFEQPEQQLQQTLDRGAVLMFQQGRHAVYALEP
jgi:hypothetical protein